MLGDLAALGPFFAVGSHPPAAPPRAPWRPGSELTSPDGPLRARVVSVRAALAARNGRTSGEVEPRVAASAVHLGLVARLVSPALGAAVLRCPLDLRLGGLWWQDVTGGPAPLSVPVSAGGASPRPAGDRGPEPPPGDRDRLLIEEVVAPVTAAIALLVPVSGRVLWGNVASAVNAAAAQVARQRPDLAAEAWRAAGQLFGSRRLRAERTAPGPAFRRSSCCLFYRLAPGNPAAICGDCLLGARAGRRARLSRTEAAYSLPRHARARAIAAHTEAAAAVTARLSRVARAMSSARGARPSPPRTGRSSTCEP